MKIKITLTSEEVAEVLAQHVSTRLQLPAYARHVKRSPYEWDGYTVEVDDEEPPAPIAHPITDDLGDVREVA